MAPSTPSARNSTRPNAGNSATARARTLAPFVPATCSTTADCDTWIRAPGPTRPAAIATIDPVATAAAITGYTASDRLRTRFNGQTSRPSAAAYTSIAVLVRRSAFVAEVTSPAEGTVLSAFSIA